MSAQLLARLETTLAEVLRALGITRLCPVERAVRVVEFGAVGLTGAVLNLAVFLWLVGVTSALVAGTVAFAGTVGWTFLLNWLVTFERPGSILRRFGRYLGVYAVGYVVYIAALLAGLHLLALPSWLSGLGAVAGGGFWNYLGSEWYALR
jgi:putative flippase GtrA